MKWLVRLYPLAWRDRYEDEFLALLDQQPASLLDYLDVAASIALTWLNPRFRDAAVPTYVKGPAFYHPVIAFPDNMRDMFFEKELYRTRMSNGHNM